MPRVHQDMDDPGQAFFEEIASPWNGSYQARAP
jgi:hypothetical protein